MASKADQDVLLEKVAVSQDQGSQTNGTGRAKEVRDHDGRQQQILLASVEDFCHQRKAMSDEWIGKQGLVNIKKLWCVAQGYRPTVCFMK